jgi:hypothetical protein
LLKKSAWGYLSDDERKTITNDLINILLKVNPVLFATVIKKKEHYEKYHIPEPISQLPLRYTVTRFSRFLNRIKDHGIIIYDTESGRSDINIRNFILKSREKGIIHQGDEFFNPMAGYRTQDNLECVIESIFFTDSQTSPVLQLVDWRAPAATPARRARTRRDSSDHLGLLIRLPIPSRRCGLCS